MVGLVGGVALAVLGRDYAKGHRGKYRSAKGAALYLRRLGFDSPAAMLDTLFEERPVAKARRGDLVLSDAGVPGVCLGSKAAFIGMTDEREGLITLPRTSWVRAWSVGN